MSATVKRVPPEPRVSDQPWPSPHQHPPLGRGELHVWRIALSSTGEIAERDLSDLSHDERARAHRYRFPEHREQFATTRLTLRRLLGRYLDITPRSVPLAYGAFGKPELVGQPLHFNVAHTRGLALVAVSAEAPVGVDVEMLRADLDSEEIATQCLAPVEVEALRAVPAHERAAAFFERWTLKEAYVKAIGVGLHHDLHAFSVMLEPRQPPRLCGIDDPDAWMLTVLQPAVGYMAAVAVGAMDVGISRWTVDG